MVVNGLPRVFHVVLAESHAPLIFQFLGCLLFNFRPDLCVSVVIVLLRNHVPLLVVEGLCFANGRRAVVRLVVRGQDVLSILSVRVAKRGSH